MDKHLSEVFERLRDIRKKFFKHRSMTNKKQYEEERDQAIALLEQAREKWKISQYEKISTAGSDKEKWKIINNMTNCETRMEVQPIRFTDPQSKKVGYFFEDHEILKEMEKYHIEKESSITAEKLDQEVKKLKALNSFDNPESIMNSEITDTEVSNTFGTCTGAAGPDNFKGNLIDNANRNLMTKCLKILWNKAWDEGVFLDRW